MIKKVIRMSCVLFLIILLGSGCVKEDNAWMYEPPQEELDAMWEALVEFGEEYRDTLNEMSEFFADAVDKEVFYQAMDEEERRKSFPSIEELAEGFTDEESKMVLENLSPYYCKYSNDVFIEIRYVYGRCGEQGKNWPYDYWFVYLDTDGEQLEEYLEFKRHDLYFWSRIFKLNEHLYAVEETCQGT